MTQKILIADDEPSIVFALEFLLEQSGYQVAVARNGDEALEQMEIFKPDLILLEVMMPGRNGHEVCQKIRENNQWNGVKVVFLSAKGRDLDISKGLALGADAYITKPFSTKYLLAQVQDLLAGRP